jgi:hypothetical protein
MSRDRLTPARRRGTVRTSRRMVMGRKLVAAFLAGAIVAASAATAAAFDLNGTWAGKITCKGIVNGARESVTLSPTLFIDDGAALQLAADGIHYSAAEYPNPLNPNKGEVAVIRCDTSPTRSGAEFGGEFGRLKVTTKPEKGTGSITGTSLKIGVLIQQTVYTCHWSFKRLTLARPSLDGCTAPTPP